MRKIGIALAAALLTASCSSANEVSVVAQAQDEAQVDAPSTTELPTTTTSTNPPEASTTSTSEATAPSTSAPVDELAEEATVSDLEERDHMLRPWWPNIDEAAIDVHYREFPEAFGPNLTCSEAETFELIESSLIVSRQIEFSDSDLVHYSGFVPPEASAVNAIDEIASTNGCIQDLIADDEEGTTLTIGPSPAVEGIASAASLSLSDGETFASLVVATTGGRDVHLIGLARGDEIDDSEIISLLEDLASRSDAAAERIEFCDETFNQPQRTRVDDPACAGFQLYSPGLRPGPSQTEIDLLETIEITNDLLVTPDLLIRPGDIGLAEPPNFHPVTAPSSTICEAELGDVARLGNAFDQWLNLEARISNPAEEEEIIHIIGEAPDAETARSAVEALATYEQCEEFSDLLAASSFATGLADNLPQRVTAGTIWRLEEPDGLSLVGDFALDNGLVSVIIATGPNVTEERILELLDISLSRLDEHEAASQ